LQNYSGFANFALPLSILSQMDRSHHERSHHALREYLKQYANEQKQWDRWIGLV